jgi:CheY-like chemotaxis protein
MPRGGNMHNKLTGEKKPRVLVVEDNEEYRAFAARALDVNYTYLPVDFASDYSTGNQALDSEIYTGAIFDCFMPDKEGSGDISKGIDVLEKIKNVANYREPESPLALALRQVSNTVGLEAAKYIAKISSVSSFIDGYHAIELAMKESENNQPLGVLLAEKAEELGIPFILATSTNHHGITTQPITDVASAKGWTLVDCAPNREDEKATEGYWRRAYKNLMIKGNIQNDLHR